MRNKIKVKLRWRKTKKTSRVVVAGLIQPQGSNDLPRLEVSGIGQDLTDDALREQVKVNKPLVMFLSEIKCKDACIARIAHSLGFNNIYFVPTSGRFGGMCLWWKYYIIVQVMTYNNFIWVPLCKIMLLIPSPMSLDFTVLFVAIKKGIFGKLTACFFLPGGVDLGSV
ncbi:hypothetical protein ACFX13_030952 [Malus domestica]